MVVPLRCPCLCPSPFTSHICLSLTTQPAVRSSIHLPTPSPQQSIALFFSYSTEAICPCFCAFFPSSPSASQLFLFLPLFLHLPHPPSSQSLLSHPVLPCLAGVTVTDVPRPQTSASLVPAASLSADQSNRSSSPQPAVLTAALMCSWAAWGG